jgi:hypothetical protein
VQAAIEDANSDQTRMEITSELQGHVWQALECPHANYVLQKCISAVPPHALHFVVDEIMCRSDGAIRAAQDRFGCRIIQRLLENCNPMQVSDLAHALLDKAKLLAPHAFGNYVLQHLLVYGTDDQRHRLLMFIQQNVQELSFDQYAASVVAKALRVAPTENVDFLVHSLLSKSCLLSRLAICRHGSLVVKSILEQANSKHQEEVVNKLRSERALLRSTNCARTRQLLRIATTIEEKLAREMYPLTYM